MLHEVRGRGLMIGIEFGRPSSWKLRGSWTALQAARKGLFAQTIVHALFHQHRILTQVSGDHLEVIKLIPPLIIGEREVDRFVDAFIDVMDEAHRGSGPDLGLRQDPGQAGSREVGGCRGAGNVSGATGADHRYERSTRSPRDNPARHRTPRSANWPRVGSRWW